MDARSPDLPAKGSPQPPVAAGASKSTSTATDDKDSKKRGRPKDGKAKAAPKEKSRKISKDTKPKQQPVDVDRQCGVPIVNSEGQLTGALCARSLTCKTHSMGAKRAVLGRSQPYDVLLSAYQQKNQLKSAAGGHLTGASKSRMSAASRAAAAAAASHPDSDPDDEPPLPDSEEISQVLHGAMMSAPQPLDTGVIVPARMRSQRLSLTELLYKATTQVPPPPPASSSPMAAIIASTQSMLGRCVVFDKYTHIQTVRPSQIYAYERLAQQRPQVDARANPVRIAQGSSSSSLPQSGRRPSNH